MADTYPHPPLSSVAEALDMPLTTLERLRFHWDALPPLCQGLAVSGGRIRQELEDFQVRELPLYLPEGEGSHAYALVEKRGLTTRDVLLCLMEAGVAEKDIGTAGLKDKYAVTQQWLSVPQRQADAFDALGQHPQIRVLERSRHKNKLGIGHLRGNAFRLRVRGLPESALVQAQAVMQQLEQQGVPNYFGPQRFGRFGNNAIDGLKLARGQRVPGGHRLKRFFIASLQSCFFNHLLAMRMERGLYAQVLLGDWAKKHSSGGMFIVDDAERESLRAHSVEISSALPLYGKKVKVSPEAAGELEQEALEHLGLRWLDFRMLKGSRRSSRVCLQDWSVTPCDDGYWLSFSLPKGSFATSVLRELLGNSVDSDSPTDEGDVGEDADA